MRRAGASLLTLLTVLSCTSAAWSQLTTPDGFSAVATAELYDGVEYVKLSKTSRPVITHVAHVLPGADVDLRVVNANDKISKSSRDLETTSSMCKRVHCIVGVNGDFHKLGAPAGGVIVNGRMLHSPDPDRPQLTLTKDGHFVAGAYPWSGTLSASDGGPATTVASVNEAPPLGGVALFTPDYGSNTDLSTRTELVVKGSGLGALNQAKELELVSIRIGPGAIPSGGAVLSGGGVIYGPGPSGKSKPRSGGPTVSNPTGRFGPVAGVGGQLASGELPVGPWLRGAGRGSPTLSATPAGEEPAADGSVSGEAQPELEPGSTTDSTYGDYLGKSLPLAAGNPGAGSLIGYDGSSGPSALPVLFVGLAGITSLSLGLLGKRRWDRYSAIRAYGLGQLPQ